MAILPFDAEKKLVSTFKEHSLEGRIVVMPFQPLQNGELHQFLALIDVYLDTLLCNGHTACHDVFFWADGVLITVQGTRLASRMGADLLLHSWSPENKSHSPACCDLCNRSYNSLVKMEYTCLSKVYTWNILA
jgi:hypothetical protein